MKRGLHAAAWVLLAVTAFVLWPHSWGGTMTYVITNGTSMKPTFSAGDFALLRTADDYNVGDVVAYDSSELNQVVMHRVKSEQNGIYTFQGDNNDFVDPDKVGKEQVLGRLLLRVPQVGLVTNWLLRPVNLLVMTVALALLFGDRKKKSEASAVSETRVPLTRLRLRALALPPAAVMAEVVDEADLERVAAHLDRPVFEVDGDRTRYVLDGSVVYTWAQAAAMPTATTGRRKTPQGRDWGYSERHLRPVANDESDAAAVS